MTALFNIIKKNFKLLVRSKSSALIIILGPMLVIFLVGIAFDNMNRFSINIGTFSEGYSELSDSFVDKLENSDFSVQKVDSEQSCVDQIKSNRLHTCIVFPKDLKIESGKVNEIVFYVDNSKMNLVWMVLDTLSTSVEERSSEVSTDLTKNLLDKISSAQDQLSARKPTIDSLRSENSVASEKVTVFSSKAQEFKEAAADIKAYILEKLDAIEVEAGNVYDAVDDSNATDSQKDDIQETIASIDTLLYNTRSKIQDPDGLSGDDWTKMVGIVDSIDSQVNVVKQSLSSSSAKINDLQASLDSIKADLAGIKVKDAATIINPVTTTIRPVTSESTYLNYMFPSLIVLVVMFISVLLSNTLVMMEKHSPAYFRNFITPTADITFIFATYLTNLILVSIQLAIILVISSYFFKAQILQSLNQLIPGLLLITTLFTFVGMLIGYLFTSEETSTLAAISVGSVFLFLSSVVLPLESMPAYIRDIARFNPFVLSEDFLRKALFFSADFSRLSFELKWLGIYAGVLFVVIWVTNKLARKHIYHKIVRLKYKAAKKRAARLAEKKKLDEQEKLVEHKKAAVEKHAPSKKSKK